MKPAQDHILLRREKGGASQLDTAARAMGVSRAAYARLLLPALMGAIAPRVASIEVARARAGQSLGRFLSQALDAALSAAAEEAAAPEPEAAAEFDALFGRQP